MTTFKSGFDSIFGKWFCQLKNISSTEFWPLTVIYNNLLYLCSQQQLFTHVSIGLRFLLPIPSHPPFHLASSLPFSRPCNFPHIPSTDCFLHSFQFVLMMILEIGEYRLKFFKALLVCFVEYF